MTGAPTTTAADGPAVVVADCTCLACGCLCDDLAVTVQAGQVGEVGPDCALGRGWFQAPHPGGGEPAARVAGDPASLDAALGRAAEILGQARSPVVWGLTHSAVEAVSLLGALADRLGATVDLAGSTGRAGFRAAFVRAGLISATLGEIRDRADTVLFWGNHPDATHPRHAERYSTRALGRFVAGRRTVLVVNVGSAGLEAGSADQRITLNPANQEAALGVLLALVRGGDLDAARVWAATGVALEDWQGLADRLRAGRWVAIFFGVATGRLGAVGWDRLLASVEALHRDGRRAVALPLGEAGNVAGAEAALVWQGGAPGALDFGPGWPAHRPGEATLADRLRRGTVDAVLAIGPDPRTELAADLHGRLAALPLIRIAPDATRADLGDSGWCPRVGIAVGRLGIEAGGTVARVDGLMLPVHPPLLGSPWPDERTILRALLHRLGHPGGTSTEEQSLP